MSLIFCRRSLLKTCLCNIYFVFCWQRALFPSRPSWCQHFPPLHSNHFIVNTCSRASSSGLIQRGSWGSGASCLLCTPSLPTPSHLLAAEWCWGKREMETETRKFCGPAVRITLVALLPVLENTCLRNQYRCSNGNCINSIWWCDFDNDCGDMSDERNCRECPSRQGRVPRLLDTHHCSGGWLGLMGCGLWF